MLSSVDLTYFPGGLLLLTGLVLTVVNYRSWARSERLLLHREDTLRQIGEVSIRTSELLRLLLATPKDGQERDLAARLGEVNHQLLIEAETLRELTVLRDRTSTQAQLAADRYAELAKQNPELADAVEKLFKAKTPSLESGK